MNDARSVVFCDFDGTIARRDVGYNLFRHFSGGRNEELLPDWKAGILSSRDILLKEAAMVHASPEVILRFLDRFDIDESFVEFQRLCQASSVPLIVVSEGLDFYIKDILSRYHLADIPIICNTGYLERNGIRVEFPHTNRTCRRCGSCKGERIAEYRQRVPAGCQMVFVGDGYSDACAAREADILFAKNDLEQYCLSENIAYNRFTSFQDVASQLARRRYLVT